LKFVSFYSLLSALVSKPLLTGVLLSTLLHAFLHPSHHLLNVLLQIANKLGLSKKKVIWRNHHSVVISYSCLKLSVQLHCYRRSCSSFKTAVSNKINVILSATIGVFKNKLFFYTCFISRLKFLEYSFHCTILCSISSNVKPPVTALLSSIQDSESSLIALSSSYRLQIIT
jgi:hypothetical protein